MYFKILVEFTMIKECSYDGSKCPLKPKCGGGVAKRWWAAQSLGEEGLLGVVLTGPDRCNFNRVYWGCGVWTADHCLIGRPISHGVCLPSANSSLHSADTAFQFGFNSFLKKTQLL